MPEPEPKPPGRYPKREMFLGYCLILREIGSRIRWSVSPAKATGSKKNHQGEVKTNLKTVYLEKPWQSPSLMQSRDSFVAVKKVPISNATRKKY